MVHFVLANDNKTTVVLYDHENDPYFVIIIPAVGFIGLLLTILCFTIFTKSIFKTNVYIFLKYESAFIGFDLLLTSLRPFHHNNDFEFARSFVSQFYYVYLLVIFASVLEMAAILCHLMSTYDLYLLVSNLKRPKLLEKIPNIVTCLIIFLFSCLVYFYLLFVFKVGGHEINQATAENKTRIRLVYQMDAYEFSKSSAKKVIEIGVFVLRDGLSLLLLIGLNVMIFLKIRKSLRKKRLFLSQNSNDSKNKNNQNNSNSTNKLSRLKNAELRTAVMVICVGISYTIGRIPILSVYIIRNFFENDLVLLLNKISVLCVYISYATYFFIYYVFNNKFRKVFHSYFKCCRICRN